MMATSGRPRANSGAVCHPAGGAHRDAGTNQQSLLVTVDEAVSPHGRPTSAQPQALEGAYSHPWSGANVNTLLSDAASDSM